MADKTALEQMHERMDKLEKKVDDYFKKLFDGLNSEFKDLFD